jgi:hypothetical protein
MSESHEPTLGQVSALQRGFDLPAQDRIAAPDPIVSSCRIAGHHALPRSSHRVSLSGVMDCSVQFTGWKSSSGLTTQHSG